MPSIQHLNYDALNCLADYLGAEDFLSLCLSCKSLYRSLLEHTPSNLAICEKTLKNSAPHSWEYVTTRKVLWRTTEERKLAFREAFRRYCARKRAFALGSPLAAYVLSSGSDLDFVYGDGAVVYKVHDRIEFLDLRATGRRAYVPLEELSNLIQRARRLRKCELVWLREEIVVLNIFVEHDTVGLDKSFLLAIDFSNPTSPRPCMDPQQLDSNHKFFVRHNRDYLYWGVHSGTSASHCHHEWVVQGIVLSQNATLLAGADPRFERRKSLQLQLKNLPGSHVGSEIDFRIHQQFFYAVSNCEFDLAEIDWTSFYHCLRFPIDQPDTSMIQRNDRLYRRQHDEGVIQDGWIKLNFQVDEATDELMIVEARDEFRPEYQPNGPRHARTWYTTKIDFDQLPDALGPENDPFYPLRDDKSNYAPRQDRYAWQMHFENLHPEYQSTLAQLKYTKYMAYNLNTQSFLDLVLSTNCQFDGSCLQLRAGRRRLQLFSTPADFVMDSSIFHYNHIRNWPPPAWESELAETAHSVMSLANNQNGQVSAWPTRVMGDDRFLLILLRDNYNRSMDRLVLLSFDKFTPVSAPNVLGSDDRPASMNAANYQRGRDPVQQPSLSMQATFDSTGITYDDHEVLDAEDLDLDEILEDAWL